jgi:hypothetical protein
MKQTEDKSMSFASLLLRILSNSKLLLKSIAALTLLLILLWTGVVVIWLTVEWLQPPFQVVVKDSGAVVLSPSRAKKTAVFQLSSNGGIDTPWIDTEIPIEEGKKFTITASGRVCLAFHHMRQGEYTDAPPPHPWVGPEGLVEDKTLPPRTLRQEDSDRAKYKVHKELGYGRLIGVISNEVPDKSAEIIDVGKKLTNYESHRSGRLWLTVNDIWLDRSIVNSITDKTDEWKADIIRKNYWNVWYDDNAGSFLVTIEFEP